MIFTIRYRKTIATRPFKSRFRRTSGMLSRTLTWCYLSQRKKTVLWRCWSSSMVVMRTSTSTIWCWTRKLLSHPWTRIWTQTTYTTKRKTPMAYVCHFQRALLMTELQSVIARWWVTGFHKGYFSMKSGRRRHYTPEHTTQRNPRTTSPTNSSTNCTLIDAALTTLLTLALSNPTPLWAPTSMLLPLNSHEMLTFGVRWQGRRCR